MPTQCSQEELDFGSCGGRKLVGAFDGGAITSNGGALLLGAADRSIRLTDRLAKCFRDLRLADGITHAIADLLRQRIFGLALGYEDAIARGAVGFDAIKHLVLCRIERRPPRLDMAIYPYLPRATVTTTSARSYMELLAGAAS